MLLSLAIRDIVLIETLDLDFGPGLNVLTGETGAGKSILLDALGFAIGRRRRGVTLCARALTPGRVTAVFEVGAEHPVRDVLRRTGPAGWGWRADPAPGGRCAGAEPGFRE